MTTQKEKIQADIAALQAKLTVLNQAPTDTYSFGTIMLFSSTQPKAKWYYVKMGEELWQNVNGGPLQDLASWILQAKENTTYFEAYVLTVAPAPIYSSS